MGNSGARQNLLGDILNCMCRIKPQGRVTQYRVKKVQFFKELAKTKRNIMGQCLAH